MGAVAPGLEEGGVKRLFTMYHDGYEEYSRFREVTWPAMVEFGRLHSYEVVEWQWDGVGPVPGWGKLPALIGALESGCAAALWVDADVLIRGGGDVLWLLAENGRGKCMAMPYDARHTPPVVCCFWLVLRPALPFLRAVWAQRDWPHHPAGETKALHRTLRAFPQWMRRVHVLDDAWLGPEGQPGRLVHADYNAGNVEERVQLLRAYQ